jgi:hypothetical protein
MTATAHGHLAEWPRLSELFLMGIVKWIRDRSERSRSFVRWSSDELAERKHYLEAKLPDEFKREDCRLLIEWLFQRYLPSDYVMTEAAWSERMKTIMARVDPLTVPGSHHLVLQNMRSRERTSKPS